jgi:cell division septation protein DedD
MKFVSPPALSSPSPPAYERPLPQAPQTGSACIYRIQLGAFSNPDNARKYFARLQSVGFSPMYEKYGSLWRVVITGVKAANMAQIIKRLQAAGFTDVWIREEK